MRKNFFYYLFPSILEGGVGLFLIIPISTYYLSPKDFGAVAILTVFAKLASASSSVGVGWVLGGNYFKLGGKERDEFIFNTLFVSILFRTAVVAAFALLGIGLLPRLVASYEREFLYFFWLLLSAEWLSCLWESVSYIIILQKKSKIYAVLDMIMVFSNFIVLVVCLTVLRLKAISLVYAQLAYCLAGFIFCFFYIGRSVIMRIRRKWVKEIIRLGLPATPLNVFEMISNSIERFFIQKWTGLTTLGIYTHSLNYRTAFMFPIKAFSNSLSPQVLEGVSLNDEALIHGTKDILKKWTGLMVLAGVGVALFSKEAISLLTHNKFTAASPFVSLWFMLMMVYSFGISYSQFLFARKKTRFILFSETTLGILSWGVTALAVRYFSAIGAVLSVVGYYLVLYIVRRTYSRKLGSANFEGRAFWVCFFSLGSLIAYVNLVPMAITAKLILFLLSAILIIRHFKFVGYLRYLLKGLNHV